MKYNLRTEHLELSDLDHEQIDEKLDRLQKHLEPPFVIDVTLQHDTHHRHGAVVTCTINVEHGKKVFHAERSDNTVQNALDEAVNTLQKELGRAHDKDKHKRK